MNNVITPSAPLLPIPDREKLRETREAAMRAQYPAGAFVRLKPGEAESYQAAETAKLKDRVGIIRSHQVFAGNPIVDFPAVGRRKFYTKVFHSPQHALEVMTDEAEIKKWRDAFAETAAKAEARKAKKA